MRTAFDTAGQRAGQDATSRGAQDATGRRRKIMRTCKWNDVTRAGGGSGRRWRAARNLSVERLGSRAPLRVCLAGLRAVVTAVASRSARLARWVAGPDPRRLAAGCFNQLPLFAGQRRRLRRSHVQPSALLLRRRDAPSCTWGTPVSACCRTFLFEHLHG